MQWSVGTCPIKLGQSGKSPGILEGSMAGHPGIETIHYFTNTPLHNREENGQSPTS